MKIEGITPGPMRKNVEHLPSSVRDDQKLKESCKQFESLFLNQLLTSMRKTIPKSDLFGKNNNEKEMYDSMMDQQLAQSWASSDGIGLANVLYQQLKQGK